MKVTLIIEDSGGGLEISGSGGSFGGTLSGAQQYRGAAGPFAPAVALIAGAYDGGAATSAAASGSGAAPAQFMGQNTQSFVPGTGGADIAAGAAPGAAQMNEATAVDQSSAAYAEPPRRAGAGRGRRAPQRRRSRATPRRAR